LLVCAAGVVVCFCQPHKQRGVGEKRERPERVYVLPHNIFPKTARLDKASVIMIVAVQH
jgi:hypothetical protein